MEHRLRQHFYLPSSVSPFQFAGFLDPPPPSGPPPPLRELRRADGLASREPDEGRHSEGWSCKIESTIHQAVETRGIRVIRLKMEATPSAASLLLFQLQVLATRNCVHVGSTSACWLRRFQ
eukprot:2510033-Rhodomonas_salina.1